MIDRKAMKQQAKGLYKRHYALLIVLCALSAAEHRYVRALLWFAAALLIKPQALLFAPLGLVAIVVGIARTETPEMRRQRLKGFCMAPWILTLPPKREKGLAAIDIVCKAREDFEAKSRKA